MHNKNRSENEANLALSSLEELSHTIDAMADVVQRLRERLSHQFDEKTSDRTVEEKTQALEPSSAATSQSSVGEDSGRAADSGQASREQQTHTDQRRASHSLEEQDSFVLEISQDEIEEDFGDEIILH